MKVTLPYTPRKQQAFLHSNLDKFRYSLLCCHRRFGKTVLCILHLIKCAMTNKHHAPRFAYIATTYSQAKKIAWDYLKFYTEKIPGTKWNESELRCDFGINGARITLLSSENPDSIRGIYLDGCIIDEAAHGISNNLINEVITPALSDRKGFMILVGTPNGMNNLFYDYFQKAQSNAKWLLYRAKASETGIVDKEELKAALDVMGKDKYQQEFETSFIGNIVGSIYGDLISELEDKKQVSCVPLNPAYSVNTAWDLGFSDQTAIIFFQQVGGAINICDYYENRNQALPHYIQVLKEKDYVYENHFAPHDVEVTSFSTGKTRLEVAHQMGIDFRVSPKTSIEDGIHACKMVLKRTWIDVDHCKKLIDALRHYHRKYNDKERTYKIKPVHDWSSHAADAFRTLSTGINEISYRTQNRQTVAETNYKLL